MKKLGVFIPILLIIVLAFSIIPNVSAATIKIQPASEDTYIYSTNPALNFGSMETLRIVQFDSYRALVKYDLSSIPSGSNIQSATLSLYFDWSRSSGNPLFYTFDAHRVTKDWDANSATWQAAKAGDPWSTAGGDYASTPLASTIGPGGSGIDIWFTWDVTEIVRDWIENGQSNYGFLIKVISGTARADFRSSDWSGDETTKPILEIVYITHAVGGFFTPTNKLTILAPYIALVGLIGAISTIFAIRKWRKD